MPNPLIQIIALLKLVSDLRGLSCFYEGCGILIKVRYPRVANHYINCFQSWQTIKVAEELFGNLPLGDDVCHHHNDAIFTRIKEIDPEGAFKDRFGIIHHLLIVKKSTEIHDAIRRIVFRDSADILSVVLTNQHIV